MMNKLAFIKSKIKLHKRSTALCVWNMILSATIIPFVICMAAWIYYNGELPTAYRYGQFVIYVLVVGRCWYSCYLRKWSHSYMLDYTQKILDPEIWYCPRCFSPIKISQQDFAYEKKIGETETWVYYSNGDIDVIREPIMSKEKETLPHLACKERSCHLGSKTQKDSAQSVEVRNQLKDNYSFCEMPRTLNKTYRLIAGDREDIYRRSMADDMCLGGFWARICLLIAILVVVSLIKDVGAFGGACDYLFGSTSALLLYATMLVLLTIAYIAILLCINARTRTIVASTKFQEEDSYFEDLKYDIYLTKRLAEAKTKERKKANKRARKEGTAPNHSYTRFTDGQWEKRKKAYRAALLGTVKSVLESHGYATDSHYYNQCYILHASSTSAHMQDCDFFITKDNCFLRGSTQFRYGVHQDYIERVIATELKNHHFDDFEFYVDKDLMCSRVSFGILAASTLDVEEMDLLSTKQKLSDYIEVMRAIREKVSPEMLRNVPPEYMVIREVSRNGFTLQ